MRSRKRSTPKNTGHKAHLVAKGLGAFSIALGLIELLGTRKVADGLDLKKQRAAVKGYGLREVINGIGLLSARNPAPWLWARVAGDGLDLATLASRSYGGRGGRRKLILMTAAGVAAITAVDILAAGKAGKKREIRESIIADYKKRSGFPRPPYQMRGIASDLMIPGDMRTPSALSPDLFEARNSTVQ